MKRAVFVLLLALLSSACDPGPLPDVRPPYSFDSRADWFPSDSYEPWPLDEAIRANRVDKVRDLLAHGANPNRRWGQTGDHFPLQDLLDSHGNTTTPVAATTALLLEHGADPNARWCPFESRQYWFSPPGCVSAEGSFPLLFAAALGYADVVALLLDAGADAAARDWTGVSALDVATSEVAFEHISRSLFRRIETRDRDALTWLKKRNGNMSDGTLFWAALAGSGRYAPPPAPRVKAKGAVDFENAQERLENRIVERLRTLLRIGANPNDVSIDGAIRETPLGIAIRENYLRAARLLLSSAADVNARECPATNIVSFRPFRRGVDPACRATNGQTALMLAAKSGNRDAVLLLLEFKADRSLRDWAGRTALDYPTTAEIRLLLEAQ